MGGWFGFTKKQKGMFHPNIYGYHGGDECHPILQFFHGGELNHEYHLSIWRNLRL